MGDISVRVLQEDDWHAYRDIRLAALRESPKAFLATYAEETKRPERYWRNCMVQAHRLLALRDEGPVGVASVEMIEGAPQSADFHDLWVTPEPRNTGVASRLVQIAVDRAIQDGCTKLYYWASTENGRAIGFAINAGFRLTSQRRTTPIKSSEFGDQEIALVLSLQRPRCGGHLDTISAHLEARPPLTKRTGAYRKRGLMSVTSSTGDRLPGKTAFPTRRRCHQ